MIQSGTRQFYGPPNSGFVQAFDCSNDDYHAGHGVSKSMLDDFLRDPAMFEGRYVSGRFPPLKATSSMELGTAVHHVLLDGETPGSNAVVMPETITRRAGREYRDFADDHQGKLLVKPGEPLALILESVQRHGFAMRLLTGGKNEHSIRWTDETGILMRCRCDCLQEDLAIVDLKTSQTTSVAAFTSTIVKYGYHRQAAIYQAGVERLLGRKLPFVFVVCQTVAPYRVECYEIEDDFVEAGRMEVAEGLRRLKDCLESGQWNSATEGNIVQIPKPTWLKSGTPAGIETATTQEIEVEYSNPETA